MRIRTPSGRELWLTYGMNVHPGGDVLATERAVREVVLPLRQRLGARGPFGLGLRFDAATVDLLHRDAGALGRLADLFAGESLVPFTGNAFAHGAFHGGRVKERVYAPSWAEPARLAYTVRFAEVLVRLARCHPVLSLSTAPGSWRAWGAGPDVDAACAANLAEAGRSLRRLAEETGASVHLGLEPEPGCTLQTTAEAAAFFEGPLTWALRWDEGARAHLGLCLDACHLAVVHEEVLPALQRLSAAGVPVVKVQASSALEAADPGDGATRAALAAFAEETWLHQVGAIDLEGRLQVATDLPDALTGGAPWSSWRPWRVHFHVPVFRDRAVGPLWTTRPLLDRTLAAVARGDVTSHLEIETYTWEALPEAEREAGSGFDLVEALAREYEYVLGVLARHGATPYPADGS